jgi:transposase-like protein
MAFQGVGIRYTPAAGKKHIVMTLIDREGDVRTVKIPNTRKGTLRAVARPIASGSAHIITDDNTSYERIDKHFASHHTANHSETFVRGLNFHTNFAESYHSLLKWSIVGTHHHLSEKHLPHYLRKREFMWNNRKASDGERKETVIGQAVGKRLEYRTPAS